MESLPTPSPPGEIARSPVRRGLVIAVVAVAAGLYGLLLLQWMGAVAGGSDSSGYLNSARLLAGGKAHAPVRAIEGVPAGALPDYTLVPLGFVPTPGAASLAPTYPPGLPLLFAGGALITGWERAPGLVMAAHALLGLGLVYLLGRACGLPRPWAVVAVGLLAASPLYLFMSLQAMSDVPALVWVTAAVWFAWRGGDRKLWLVAAGFALGGAILLRPANVLALPAVLIALGFSWRRWLPLAAGALPAALFQLAYNTALYGRALTTGYGDVSNAFSTGNLPVTLAHYAQWLPVLLTPLVLLALALPWCARGRNRAALVLGVWAAAFLGFYSFYYHTHETWWYLRFLLPAFPALLIAAMLTAHHLLARFERGRFWWVVPALALLAIAGHGKFQAQKLYAHTIGQEEHIYPDTAAWARQHLPPNALVACMQTSGALYYYAGFTLFRWDQVDAAGFQRITHAAELQGRPVFAVLFPFEVEPALREQLPGNWAEMANIRHVTVWRWDGPPPSSP